MTTAAEAIKIQGPILPDFAFESTDEFYDDMSGFGAPGFFQDLSNRHNTGVWDDNMVFEDIDLGWVSPEHGITINDERVRYVNQARPHPNGFTPFQRINGKFTIVNREVNHADPVESDFARQKAYHLMTLQPHESQALYGVNRISSRHAFIGDFTQENANNRDPFLEPLNQNETQGEHSVFGTYNVEPDGRVLFDRYPMRWFGGMMTTRNNRWAMKMDELCRIEARIKMPLGSRIDDLNDFNKLENCFAAFWNLQQLYHNRDVNGLVHSHGVQTFMPHTDSGRLNESDITEHLGHDPNVSLHTIHHHNNLETGEPLSHMTMNNHYIPHRNLPDSIFGAAARGFNASTDFHTYTVDYTTEKIGFAVDGRYLAVVKMPPGWIAPLPLYETRNDQGYGVIRQNGFGVHNGEIQRRADGSPKYMEMMILLNNAMNGKFTIAQMYNNINNRDNFPQFQGDPLMQIDFVRAVRLKEGLLVEPEDVTPIQQFTGYDIVANRPDGTHCLVARARR